MRGWADYPFNMSDQSHIKPADEARVFDELLLISARKGHRRAGERLAERWYPRLRRTAYRILRDREAAEDAVQEAWAGICAGWIQLNDPARFPAWAFGILSRKCADSLRRTIRQREKETQADAEDVSGPGDADGRIDLNTAFAALPYEQRVAASLYFGEGLLITEIATAMGVPTGTVKSRLFHARRALKTALEGDEK